jgi:hypothetical protein
VPARSTRGRGRSPMPNWSTSASATPTCSEGGPPCSITAC